MALTDHGLPGIYNSAAVTLTDGRGSAMALDVNGNVKVSIAASTAAVTGTYNSTPPTMTNGSVGSFQLDVNGNEKVVEQQTPQYEDNTNAKAVVEHRYTSTVCSADTQVKASAGFVHTITVSGTTATPTAGLLTVYDSTTESGTAIYKEWVFATDVGHSVLLDVTTTNGIYVGFDATLANVSVAVSWR